MHLYKRTAADCIFAFHCAVVLIIGFGWLVPQIWPLYMSTLVITLISELALGYCFLSKWEFDLRKQLDPSVDYDYGFSSFYTYRLTRHRLSKRFIQYAGTSFLLGSLLINLYMRLVS